MKKLPIGISDFKEVIEEDFYYVDKSLFIKEVIDDSKVISLTRPRRFGKSLGLSLLRYFFEKTDGDTSYLFKDLKIWQTGDDYCQYQGQFPVIFLSFKSIKGSKWKNIWEGLRDVISWEFSRHHYLLKSEALRQNEKDLYQRITDKEASEVEYHNSLNILSSLLYRHYGKRAVILIDEYDTPINATYKKDFYDQVLTSVQALLSGAFKDNPYLEKGVIMGIFRVARGGFFSGLNNLDEYSLLNFQFADKFGFSEIEIAQVLEDFQLIEKYDHLKRWYSGYEFGEDKTMYNPWSILKYLKSSKEGFKPFWVNTSDNTLIEDLILDNSLSNRQHLCDLVYGWGFTTRLSDSMIFPGLKEDEIAIWTLLLYGGYLKATNRRLDENEEHYIYDLHIPNKELRILYKDVIQHWFDQKLGHYQLDLLLKSITEAKADPLAETLKYLADSVFGNSANEEEVPENFYYTFVMGLLVNLEGPYEVTPYRESGWGQYGLVLKPKKEDQLTIVIRFQSIITRKEINLNEEARQVLAEIDEQDYTKELMSESIPAIFKVGLATLGKEVATHTSLET